MHNRVNFWWS